MFWRFGGYSSIAPIHAILDKPGHSLEDLLDEQELASELKQHDARLIEYLRDDRVIRRLIAIVRAPRPKYQADDEDWLDDDEPKKITSIERADDADKEEQTPKPKPKPTKKERTEHMRIRTDGEAQRRRRAEVASDTLSADVWSLIESIMQDDKHLLELWSYLDSQPPLEPQTASNFVKVNESLADKKTEAMVKFLQGYGASVEKLLKHVECPVIMDLCMKLLSLSNAEGGEGILDWLYDQNFIPILLSCFDSHHSQSLQTAAGDFLKGVITLSANAAQTQEQCIGPNELTRQLVSDEHIAQLIRSMSVGGNPLTVGVGIVIEVIRKNNSDYDPEGVSSPNHPPTSRDPIYLGTVLRLFAKHIPNFMNLLKTSERIVAHLDGTQTKEPRQARFVAGERVEPLGFDRFKTCELMAELLHCSNMALLNEKGSEAYIRSRDEERVALKAAGKLLSRYAPPGPSDEFGDFQSAEAGDSTIEEFTHTEDDDFEEVGVSSDFRDMSASKDFEDEGVPLKSPFEDDGEFVDESFPPETSQSELRDPLHEEASPSELKEFDRLKIDEVDVRSDRRPSQTELQVASAAAAAASMEVHRPVSQSDNPGDTSRATTRSTDENEITSIDFAAEDEAVNHQSPERHASQSIADPSQHHGSPSKDHSDGSFGNSASSIDTTHGMDGESDRSQSPGPENYDYTIDVEDDGSPLVGDYLKMMFVEHDVVPIILDFFFAFPWNNFLHNVVYDVVQQVFNGPMVRGFNRQLAISLFTHGNITDRIVAGNKRNEEAEKNGNRRIGYMGHLTLIAEEIVKFTERNPPEMLTQDVMDKVMDPAWVDYVEITLAHTRERDNAVLGGERPDASIGARQSALAQGFALNAGASAALANAGIGAPPSPGLEPPTHFIENLGGPSEDDDDEDGGAMGGEEGHDEYRARDGDLNMSDAPIEPDDSVQMVILPPPPPLNVPTRARRQLAARLAQKRRELEAGGVAGSEGPSTGAGEVGTLSRRPGSFEEGAGDGAVGPFTMEPERGIQSGLDSHSESSEGSDEAADQGHDHEHEHDHDHDEEDEYGGLGHRRRPSYTIAVKHRSNIEDSSDEEEDGPAEDDEEDDDDDDTEGEDEGHSATANLAHSQHISQQQHSSGSDGEKGKPQTSSSSEEGSDETDEDDEDDEDAKAEETQQQHKTQPIPIPTSPTAQTQAHSPAHVPAQTNAQPQTKPKSPASPTTPITPTKSRSAGTTPPHSRSSSGAQAQAPQKGQAEATKA